MRTHPRHRFLAGLLLGGLAAASPSLTPSFADDAKAPANAPAAKPAATPQAVATTGPATAPTTTPATTQAARTHEAIIADVSAANKEMREAIPSFTVFGDEKKRAEIAPKAIPAMKKFMAAFEELAASDPRYKPQAVVMRNDLLTILTVLGDAESEKQLTAAAAGEGKAAAGARAALVHAKWWRAANDPAAQAKLLDEARAILKANADNDAIAMEFMSMAEMGAASPENSRAIEKVVLDEAAGPRAAAMKERITSHQKLAALEGKPLVIAGPTVEGKQFTTADWKGKVVLVDFWATWCGPCREELPRVKKAYADFHDKGLEIVGVSCDETAAALKDFLAKDKEMPWPQLFDEKSPGWHALAKQFGIDGIPTMFLIDKQGVVRTVNARENFEELIPKMLEEK